MKALVLVLVIVALHLGVAAMAASRHLLVAPPSSLVLAGDGVPR